MKHGEAVERLYDLLFGELEESVRADLKFHLAECEDCRSLEETYRTLHETFHNESAAVADHPSPDEIVAYATERDALSRSERERIETHVEGCPPCRDEVQSVREVEGWSEGLGAGREVTRPRRRFAWSRLEMRLALAAAIVIAVLAYPAFLGIVGLTSARRDARDLQHENMVLSETIGKMENTLARSAAELERLGGWGGTVRLQLVRSPLREKGEPTRIEVVPEQPFVVMGVEVRVPPGLPDRESLRFEILARDGRPIATVDLSATEARSQIRATGVVTLAVPTGSFVPGLYEMRVTRRDEPGAPDLLEVGLEVSPP